MKSTSVTVRILEQIRDSIEQANVRLEQTNAGLDQTREVMDQKFDDLKSRVVEGEIRSATAMMALSGTLSDVRTLLRDRLDLKDRVERCEHDIGAIKGSIGLK